MKPFLIFACCCLFVIRGWSQQNPPAEALPAVLAFELAEYRAKREEGVKRLAESAKAQLLAIQQAQMQAGNLEATNAVTKAMAQLPITSPEKADPPAGVPTAAVSALKDHANKVFAGISGLNAQFVPRLEKVKTELLKSGDVAGANAADAKVRELKEEALKLTPPKTPAGRKPEAEESFTVEALIDGGTELHITKEGIYWMVPGGEAKPGLHEGSNEATYVNGSRWKPKWRVKGDRGPDTSDVYLITTTSPKLVVETVNVSRERFGKHESRTPVANSIKEDHFVVTIRDPEGGSRWYKLRIKAVKE
ncbi:MAG: hypothetical protein U1F81_06255 [Verrucomicrobiaceae bacterium]